MQISCLSRRQFAKSSLAFSATALVGTSAGRAIEPIERNSPSFKFSLAAYSYRSLLTGENPAMTLFDFASDCARFGLQGTELTSYYFPTDVSNEYLANLRRHCFRLGLDVSGTAIGNDFGYLAGPEREKQIDSTKTWIKRASVLGAPVIRIFAGQQKRDISEEDTHRLIVSAIEECCDFAGQFGIHLALENHGGPTASADGLLKIVRDVNNKWFGVNLDTGNFHSDDIYADLAKAAPFALNVQVKVVVKDSSGAIRPTDYQQLARILRAANFRGYIVLEYEEKGDPRAASEQQLHLLRKAFD